MKGFGKRCTILMKREHWHFFCFEWHFSDTVFLGKENHDGKRGHFWTTTRHRHLCSRNHWNHQGTTGTIGNEPSGALHSLFRSFGNWELWDWAAASCHRRGHRKVIESGVTEENLKSPIFSQWAFLGFHCWIIYFFGKKTNHTTFAPVQRKVLLAIFGNKDLFSASREWPWMAHSSPSRNLAL